MKERKSGSIITISSAAAKAGIQLLTQIVATQAGPFGIRANCITRETILTECNPQRIPHKQKQRLLDTPDDVARTALFLASDDAAWITGIILDVAGRSVMVS